MTDRYEKIRQALAMGPTPGPRRAVEQSVIGPQDLRILSANVTFSVGVNGSHSVLIEEAVANAALAAACDPDAIRELLAERDQLAAALEAAREDAEPVVRFNDDGTLDEVVGRGQFHLEQMGSGHWWMQLGPHIVNLSARGKIRAHFGRNEAAINQARGKGGKEDGND